MRQWMSQVIAKMQLRTRIAGTRGGTVGVNNTAGPLSLVPGAFIAPDVGLTYTRSGVVGLGCGTTGGEYRLGGQTDIYGQIGVQAGVGLLAQPGVEFGTRPGILDDLQVRLVGGRHPAMASERQR